MSKFYNEKYKDDRLYWGTQPSSIARTFFANILPKSGQRLLDIGCGEGRDSIFFAQNGYQVSGFDTSNEGISKSRERAGELGLTIEFFEADINQYQITEPFNVIFGSGSLHYILPSSKDQIISHYKKMTLPGGFHAFTVPVDKSFIQKDPDADPKERYWRSGEVLTHYHDWKIEYFVEEILDDIHSQFKFPVNRIIAREPSD